MSLLAVLQIVFCPVLLFLRQHSCYGIPATDDKSKYKKVSWTFLMINRSGISASFDRRIMCQRNLLWWSSIFRLTGLTQVFSSRLTSSSRTATPSGWRSSRPGRSTTTTQPSTSLTRSGIYEIFLFIYLKSNLYMKTRQFSWLEVKFVISLKSFHSLQNVSVWISPLTVGTQDTVREGSGQLKAVLEGLDSRSWRGSTACGVGLPVHVDQIGPGGVHRVVQQAEHLQHHVSRDGSRLWSIGVSRQINLVWGEQNVYFLNWNIGMLRVEW